MLEHSQNSLHINWLGELVFMQIQITNTTFSLTRQLMSYLNITYLIIGDEMYASD